MIDRTAIWVSSKNRGEIKPKSVDVHLLNPVAEAIENELLNDWVIGVDCVSAAGVVRVVPTTGLQVVVVIVVDACGDVVVVLCELLQINSPISMSAIHNVVVCLECFEELDEDLVLRLLARDDVWVARGIVHVLDIVQINYS